ncbi:hypothetical protein [Rhodococcus sp. (in: high G+C Gram-positive bacteria)]|uniref:hypothetical protein n=1 Tax=Rhodococcus sp. TaxID=1831 RepID=UPI00257E6ECB|nr:hypothetical protein [Rhodococcus sp. (in: high G+C Gram-positive bacteria)]
MTATIPRTPRTANPMCPSVGRTDPHTQRPSRLPTASITLGALSISAFWIIELSFALGVTAAICGAVATSRSTVADSETASLRALLGIVAGATGITISTGAALLPMLARL